PQILGQVKEAYATARAVGAVHSQLDLLLTRAFAVAKRVRTETAVGSSVVSVASVAVELAKKIFGSLQGRHVYLVGAGKMSDLAGIFVYDIDDLQQAVSTHVADRRREAERAEAIVQSEVERFQARLQSLDVVPTIVSLHDHLETIRQAEIDRVRARLGPLSPEQEMAVET